MSTDFDPRSVGFSNYTDHLNCSYFGSGWVVHCVHPIIHMYVFLMLANGNPETKAAMLKIIEQPWYPGVITNHIEHGIPQLKEKIWTQMDHLTRPAIAEYARSTRCLNIPLVPLHVMEERFNSKTPDLKSFRDFFHRIKHRPHIDFDAEEADETQTG